VIWHLASLAELHSLLLRHDRHGSPYCDGANSVNRRDGAVCVNILPKEREKNRLGTQEIDFSPLTLTDVPFNNTVAQGQGCRESFAGAELRPSPLGIIQCLQHPLPSL